MTSITRYPLAVSVGLLLGTFPADETLDPCKLLTKQEVETVLPRHDGGTIMHSGGSLVEGVDAYQCSYVNDATDLFTVVVNVAADAAHLDGIRPDFAGSNVTEVAVGEGGWLRGEPDDLKLTAIKGRAVLDLELMAPGAGKKGDALVALGRAAIAKL